MGKLLTIDGPGILRRVHEVNPDPDSPEKANATLRYSLSTFRKLLATHQPTHVLAAFDFGGSTWRHHVYGKYRENKAPMPEGLQQGLPEFHDSLAAIGIPVVCVPAVEAADVIGTAVLRWLGENRGEVIVASADRGLHALIAHGALVWDVFKNEWHDRDWVEQRFGVPPAMLPDLLALMGDAAVGIPGVPTVGQKKAAKLLQAYGNLDAVMAGAGILKNPLGEILRREGEALTLSRTLVTLKTDVTLGVTWKMLELQQATH
ncbi:MAG: 5'-3' exonuclease H3TH domain-containing protein [Pseudomonadota bacterium]